MGTLFGILLIALAGQKVIENARGSSKDAERGQLVDWGADAPHGL